MLLDGDGHVAQHGGTARTRDGEQVREVRSLQPEVRARPGGPRFFQRVALAARDVQLQQRTGESIEAGRKNDDVEVVVLAGGADSRFGDLDDRLGLQVDQENIVAVERLEIAGVDGRPFGGKAMVAWRQHFSDVRIPDNFRDLFANEIRSGVVGLGVLQDVPERGTEPQSAALPGLFVNGSTFLVSHRNCRPVRDAEGMTIGPGTGLAPDVVVGRSRDFHFGRCHGTVSRGNAVVGGALENGQMPGQPGQYRRGLDAGRAGADLPDALAGEVDALGRPIAGVIPTALEAVEPLEVRHVGRRQTTDRSDQELRHEGLAAAGLHRPNVRGVVE